MFKKLFNFFLTSVIENLDIGNHKRELLTVRIKDALQVHFHHLIHVTRIDHPLILKRVEVVPLKSSLKKDWHFIKFIIYQKK